MGNVGRAVVGNTTSAWRRITNTRYRTPIFISVQFKCRESWTFLTWCIDIILRHDNVRLITPRPTHKWDIKKYIGAQTIIDSPSGSTCRAGIWPWRSRDWSQNQQTELQCFTDESHVLRLLTISPLPVSPFQLYPIGILLCIMPAHNCLPYTHICSDYATCLPGADEFDDNDIQWWR